MAYFEVQYCTVLNVQTNAPSFSWIYCSPANILYFSLIKHAKSFWLQIFWHDKFRQCITSIKSVMIMVDYLRPIDTNDSLPHLWIIYKFFEHFCHTIFLLFQNNFTLVCLKILMHCVIRYANAAHKEDISEDNYFKLYCNNNHNTSCNNNINNNKIWREQRQHVQPN